MRVLFLGPDKSPVLDYLRTTDDQILSTADRITPAYINSHAVEFAISHGYRHIVRPAVLAKLPGRIVNLHISYLPWNRGADPNLWSFVDDTPKGVSIHYMDEGLDTGDLIAQRRVEFGEGETLASSYARLQQEVLSLFIDTWPSIRTGTCPRVPQRGAGSYHRSADKANIMQRLSLGWDTTVAALTE